MTSERKRDLVLTLLIFAGMVLALLYGWGAQRSPFLLSALPWFSWTGVLFKQLLMVIIYPLVLASMVVGVVNLGDIRKVGGLAGKGLLYFMTTTALAVALGLVLVNIFNPGDGVNLDLGQPPENLVGHEFGPFFLEMLKNTFKNPFQSLAQGDVLAILSFGLLLGAVTSTLGDAGKPVARFFEGLNQAMMRLTAWVMWLAPIGVFALLAEVVALQGLLRFCGALGPWAARLCDAAPVGLAPGWGQPHPALSRPASSSGSGILHSLLRSDPARHHRLCRR